MKYSFIPILVLLLIRCSNDFSYHDYFDKYDPNTTDFMEVVDTTLFTEKELGGLEMLRKLHGDTSMIPYRTAFMHYLYHRTYGSSYLDDLELERTEKFIGDFMKWEDGESRER